MIYSRGKHQGGEKFILSGIGNKLLSGSGMENRSAYFAWQKKRERRNNSETDSTSDGK